MVRCHAAAFGLVLASCGPAPTDAQPVPTATDDVPASPAAATQPSLHIVAERSLRRARLVLARDEEGRGHFLIAADGDPLVPIRCDDRLEGAWGLWVDDIDGDGNAEALVALHKRARFDDTLANRLHVYGFEGDRCVPAWRGTRLAGRFDAVATDPQERGTLLVHEWLSPTRRRVARYRWHGFGYRLEEVPWTGTDAPPEDLIASLDFGPSPASSQGR